MPDRSLRLLSLPPRPPRGGERVGVLLRERPSSPPDASSGRPDGGKDDGTRDDNPFAPPPEGTPDKPWQPRRPAGDDRQGTDSPDSGGPGGDGRPPAWGSQWSDRQPGRSPSGFGERPGQGGGRDGRRSGPQGPGPGPGMRWDPTDPAQRHARYALLCGMWGFFFALFGWSYLALLLGALSLYWGISALRAKPRAAQPGAQDPSAARQASASAPASRDGGTEPGANTNAGAGPVPGGRPQTTAAVTGLVTASLAIFLVAAQFTVHLAYRDYYACTNDALTGQARQSCEQLLPSQLRDLLGTEG